MFLLYLLLKIRKMSKLKKLESVLDYLLDEQFVKLNVPTLKKIHEIDPDFDFNKFKIKRIPITIFYAKEKKYDNNIKQFVLNKLPLKMKEMNKSNCHGENIYDMIGFKMGDDKVHTDLNLFVRKIDDVSCIIQNKYDWQTKKSFKTEYQVKFLKSKPNIKTFRFVFHSYSKQSHTLSNRNNSQWGNLEKYYINGNPVEESIWKKESREYKLKRILKKEIKK